MGDNQKDAKSSAWTSDSAAKENKHPTAAETKMRTITKNRRERRASRFPDKTADSSSERSEKEKEDEELPDQKSTKEPEHEETWEEKRAKEKKRIQTLSESKGWTCPITLEGFYDPMLFMDGVTYETDDIQKWWKAHPNAKTGPTGIPISVGQPVANRALHDFLHYGNDLVCSITHEPFDRPVVLMGGKGQASETTFEAAAVVGALEATWSKWDLIRQRTYIQNSALELDLALSYALVPNRLLWKGKINLASLPSLPKRSSAPSFNPSMQPKRAQRHIMDTEDGKLSSLGVQHEHGTGNIEHYKNKWFDKCMFDSHGKLYHFTNCHFQNVAFSVPCWCGFRMDWCKFTNCVWMGGRPFEGKGFINNMFVSCHVLHEMGKESMKTMLIGVQTNWANDAYRNLEEGVLKGSLDC
jgi:hypothetical protein